MRELVFIFCCLFLSASLCGQQTKERSPRPERISIQQLEHPHPPGHIAIVKEPESQSVCLGQAVRFLVGIEGAGSAPHFQWQSSSDKGLNWGNIDGANQPFYDAIQNVTRAHHGLLLRAIVQAGEKTLTSRAASLLVQDMINLDNVLENQVTVEDGSVRFEPKVNMADLPDKVFFQWQKSEYGTAVWENLRGEHQIHLHKRQANYTENGMLYRFYIYGEGLCDTVYSNPALLSVLKTPVVTVTPGQSSFCGGGTATFSVRMQGATGLEKVQWQCSKNNGVSFQNIKGATGLSYFLPEIKPEMSGDRYRAILLLPGEVRMPTHEAVVTVYGAVSFSEKPTSQAVCYGDEAIFKVKAEYEGQRPSYQWQVDKTGKGDWENIAGADKQTYSIRTDKNDANGWRFRALVLVGECNSIESEPAKLTVLSDLEFNRQPTDFKVVLADDDASFFADFAGNTSDFATSWEWSATDGLSWQAQPNSTGRRLVIPRVQAEMANYQYRMRVMNKKCGRIFYSNTARIIFSEK